MTSVMLVLIEEFLSHKIKNVYTLKVIMSNFDFILFSLIQLLRLFFSSQLGIIADRWFLSN